MRNLLNLKSLAVGAGLLCLTSPFITRAEVEVTAAVQVSSRAEFTAPLAEHGSWVEVGSYGRCWRPAHVEVGWRPYADGHWVWTDRGWYWASDEPWAWACYHYGRWVYADGWVWVPDVEWAPAWVEWRAGGGYVGWAPLAPSRGFFGVFRHHPEPQFVFVESARFHDHIRPSSVVVNNTTIINKTTVINNIHHDTRTIDGSTRKRVVINEGPRAEIERASGGRRFDPVPVRPAARPVATPEWHRDNDRRDGDRHSANEIRHEEHVNAIPEHAKPAPAVKLKPVVNSKAPPVIGPWRNERAMPPGDVRTALPSPAEHVQATTPHGAQLPVSVRPGKNSRDEWDRDHDRR